MSPRQALFTAYRDACSPADQIKCLDWQARRAEFACKAPAEVIEETLAKVRTLLE
jgi:mRNA-degrading endonuclease toxin of MazEF toxin-antitoxin module